MSFALEPWDLHAFHGLTHKPWANPSCGPWVGLSWLPFPTRPSALASLKLGGNEIAVSGTGGSCSHSLRQTHSSVRLIGPEWRHKRPPMDRLRLVIKLQAFVLLSVAPLPPLCLPASSWLPTHPFSPGASPHTLKNWPGATTVYRTESLRLATLHQDTHGSGWSQMTWPCASGSLSSDCGWD